jgi:hypothetical protein
MGVIRKRKRLAKLYFNRFKHHLWPLLAFLVAGNRWSSGVKKTLTSLKLIIVIKGRLFFRKVGRQILLELIYTLRKINRRLRRKRVFYR